MKILKAMKDGGLESRVFGLFFIEWKKLFSIVLLHFQDGSRDAYHSHSFNSISWVLAGELLEYRRYENKGSVIVRANNYTPSLVPVITTRSNMHKVWSVGDTWVLTFRGPWAKTWKEYIPETDETITLSEGRKVVQ